MAQTLIERAGGRGEGGREGVGREGERKLDEQGRSGDKTPKVRRDSRQLNTPRANQNNASGGGTHRH